MSAGHHKYLARIPMDLWEELQAEAKVRSLSINELIVSACRGVVSGENGVEPAQERVEAAPVMKDAVEQEVEFLRDVGQMVDAAYRVCLEEWERIRPYVGADEKRQREARANSLMYLGLDPVLFLQAIRKMAPTTARIEAVIDEARRLAEQGGN